MPKLRLKFSLLCIAMLGMSQLACAQNLRMQQLGKEVATQTQAHLDLWFPRCVDQTFGGFHVTYDHDWTPLPDTTRNLVMQSRMTWVAAMAAEQFPEQRERFLPIVGHGVSMIREKFVDTIHGGMLWEIVMPGTDPATLHAWQHPRKHAYAMSFALYALAQAYKVTGDADALKLAAEQFRWFDKHAHDAVNGGYHEALNADGTPVTVPDDIAIDPKWDHIGTLRGYKSMNTHIHLLESFGALHAVWKDPTLAARFGELFAIVRDKIYVEPGCLNQVFTPNWKAIPTGDSFGHDVETAYLLAESAHMLEIPDDTRTWQVARNLVDHALAFGFDTSTGGFYDEGAAHKPAHHKTKYWWVQAEALNALSIMDHRFGNQTHRYRDALLKQWEYITTYQLDTELGGWCGAILPDHNVPIPGQKKGHNWKGAYHTFRALVLTSKRINNFTKKTTSH